MEILLFVVALLKILGFIVLGLLAALLVLLFLVFFVPIRYEAEGQGLTNFQVRASVRFLFRLLQAEGIYTEADDFSLSVKVFGFTCFHMGENETEKKKQKKRRQEAASVAEPKPLQKPLPEQHPQDGKKAVHPSYEKRSREEKSCRIEHPEESAKKNVQKKFGQAQKKQTFAAHETVAEEGKGSGEGYISSDLQEKEKKALEAGKAKAPEISAKEPTAAAPENTIQEERIRPTVRRIKLSEIEEAPIAQEGKRQLDGKEAAAKKDKKKKSTSKEDDGKSTEEETLGPLYFIHLSWEEKKALARVCYRFLKRVIRQIFPRKVSLRATIGTADPASTGYLLGLCGALRGVFGDAVQVQGDFQNAKLAGTFFLKGRIRLGFIAAAGVRFLLSRPIWAIIQLWRKG